MTWKRLLHPVSRRTAGACLLATVLSSGGVRANDSDALLKKGIALSNASRPFEAEEVLISIPGGDSNFAEARTLLGYSYLRRAQLVLAEEAFNMVLRLEPGRASARLGLGVSFSQRGMLEQAALQYERILRDPAVGEKAKVQHIQNLFWMGREDEAFREARRQAEVHPSNADLQTLLGFFHQLRGEGEEALRAHRKALDLAPRNLSHHFSLIAIYRGRKEWSHAYFLAQQALELDRNHPLIYQEIAEICERMGRKAEADRARLEEKRTLEAEILYTRSVRARTTDRAGEAEVLLLEAVAANPRLSKAWSDLGEIQRGSGRIEDSLGSFMRAIEENPSNPMARVGMAAALQERGEQRNVAGVSAPDRSAVPGAHRSAEAAILRALEDLPGNADLLVYLGCLREAGGRNHESSRAFGEALDIDPLHTGALLGNGRHLMRTGDAVRAAEAFRKAAELEPANTHAWQGLILAHRQAGNAKAAESACLSCIQLNPDAAGCGEALARIQMDASNFRGAAETLEGLLRRGRESKDLLDNLAFARMKSGEGAAAIDLFGRSVRLYGADVWIHQNLGFLYQGAGRFDQAAGQYRRARSLSPKDAEICHNLGFALYLAKDYAGSVEPFRQALRLCPGWGLAHFNLAMALWNLRLYAEALAHARSAEAQGVPEARRIVLALSANLAQHPPKSVSVYRPRR